MITRSTVMALLLLLLGTNVLSGQQAQQTSPPSSQPVAADDPRARRAAELIELINAWDTSRIEEYVQQNFSPGLLSQGGTERALQALSPIRDPGRRIEIERFTEGERGTVAASFRQETANGLPGILVGAEPAPPHRITGLAPMRAGAAAPAEPTVTRPLTEAEAVAELDAFLRQAAAEGRLSGAVLLAKDGQPLLQQAYGMADRERGVANTVDTKFYLGSMNKMFTAVAIAQLVEQGRLSFEDPLARYLPDFPDPEAAQKIRIEHLLTHTSGLGNIFSPRFIRERPVAVPAILEVVRENNTLAFEPGTSRQYSNTAFVVLGAIVERVTGQSYYDYVRENIYHRAGMHDSGHELDTPVPNLARGYAPARDGSGVQATDVPHGGPAGGGYSTLGDLLRFAEALRNHELLSPAMTRTVLSARPDLGQPTYGYGFIVRDGVVGHSGGNPGVYANLDIFLDGGYTSVVLINQDRGGPQPEYENRMRELVRAVQPR